MLRRVPLLRRFLPGVSAETTSPPTPGEVAKLQHRRRVLERELRRLDKALGKRHCATCAQSPTDGNVIRAERRAEVLRAAIRRIDERLSQ